MSVDTSLRKVSYTMTAGLLNYDFTFRALTSAPTDIKCKQTVIATGVETDLTYTTRYTVAINADGVGGTVTLTTAGTTAIKLTIYRDTTDSQASDYNDYNQFPADTLETDLDRRTMKSQEVAEDVARSVKVSVTSTISTITMPEPSANKALKWNATATNITNSTYEVDTYAAAAATSSAAALVSQVAAAASAAAALISENNAAASEAASTASASAAATSAASMLSSVAAAATSAAAALASQYAAATSAAAALVSQYAAGTYATNALASQNAATTSAAAALVSQNAAATSATTASNAATTASAASLAAQTASTAAIAAATAATTTANSIRQHIRCTLPLPNDYYTNVSKALCLVGRLDAAITITNILCNGERDPGTESTITLFYADSFIGTANATYLSSMTTIAGIYTSGTVSLTVPTTKCIYVQLGATPDTLIKQLHSDITFTY